MPLDQRLKRRLRLRDLDTLMAVAQSGSMAKAAGILSISQPAVSKSVSEMERTLGVKLFDRVATGVEPTRYGEALLKWSAAVFDDLRQGVKEIEFLSDPTSGELRVGATEPMQGGFIPKVIDRLSRQYPRVSVEVWPLSQSMEQLRELRARNVDLQIGRLMQTQDKTDLRTETLFNDRAFVVASPQHKMARRRKIEIADLVDELWSLPPATTNVAGRMIVDAFRSQGLDLPKRSVVTPAIQIHCGLVATGRYLAVFPGSLLQFGLQHMPLKVLPVRWPVAHAPVGITVLKERTLSPVAQLFIRHAREVAGLVKT
ncbi:MAG TPA: LysR family transcriptional regulator [Pseudolabrys sp.]|nr:LysR family transcriptional regulator [Pseudolabrys sp.]